MSDRPIFLELAGLPVAGKTTTANLLEKRLAERGVRSLVVPEAAAKSPLGELKRNWRFNAWTLCQAVSSILQHSNNQDYHLVVLDRGLFDATCWIEWFQLRNVIELSTAESLKSFARLPHWFSRPELILILRVTFETAVARRQGLEGRIVNAETISELRRAYQTGLEQLTPLFPPDTVHVLDTDDLTPTRVVNTVLNLLGARGLSIPSTAND